MRAGVLAVAATTALCAACGSIPGFEDPDLSLEPFLTLYQFRGDTSMQSLQGGVPTDNPKQALATLGHDENDEGFGGRLAVGDGFSGLEFQFVQVDNRTTSQGTLEADYGALATGAIVTTQIDLIELRGSYTAEVLRYETELREEPLDIRAGLGVALAHRQIDFTVEEVLTDIPQRNTLDDNLAPYVTARLRADWRNAGVQLDFGANPDIDFGDEFEGFQTDFEVRLDYTFDIQNLTVFGAWRRVELDGRGTEGVLGFRNDFVMDGFTLGARVTF